MKNYLYITFCLFTYLLLRAIPCAQSAPVNSDQLFTFSIANNREQLKLLITIAFLPAECRFYLNDILIRVAAQMGREI